MLTLSLGMPRAGSGWYYNLTHDLVVASGGQKAAQVRERYFFLRGILTQVNCNIGALTPRRLLLALIPALLGTTYTIKAHAGPTPFALWLLRRGYMHAAYIYRDPRDAMLSAFDNGQKAAQKGRPNAFSHLTDFDKSIDFMLEYLRIWEGWQACDLVLHTRYEDLKNDYDREAGRLAAFLKVEVSDPTVASAIERYRPEKARAEQRGIHFNKGQSGRFRQRMTGEQQQMMAEKFGPYLERMGYQL